MQINLKKKKKLPVYKWIIVSNSTIHNVQKTTWPLLLVVKQFKYSLKLVKCDHYFSLEKNQKNLI